MTPSDISSGGPPLAEYGADPKEELAWRRASIDNFDAAMIHILAERFKHTNAVSRLKARHADVLPLSDGEREAQQAERLRELASQSGLDPDFAERFINYIIQEVLESHRAARREAPLNP